MEKILKQLLYELCNDGKLEMSNTEIEKTTRCFLHKKLINSKSVIIEQDNKVYKTKIKSWTVSNHGNIFYDIASNEVCLSDNVLKID